MPASHSSLITTGKPRGLSADPAAIFPYWSFTKTVIAICALRLAEDGLISLDTPLPGEPFTLAELLGHRAGVPDYGALAEYRSAVAADIEPWPRDEILRRVRAQGPLFAPSDGWSYSNAGYTLARARLEASTGKGLETLVSELVCVPLGLTSVSLALTRAQFERVHWPGAQHYHPGWVYHGCLTGTATDAARILEALVSGRLLRPESLARMTSAHPLGGALEGRPWSACGYGLGLMIGTFGTAGRVLGHTGGGPFSSNAVYHFPDLAPPRTVACFTDDTGDGSAETLSLQVATSQ